MTKLYILNGSDKGRSFELKGSTNCIGRGPDNDIQIKDKSISRRHIKIKKKKEDGIFLIEDLKSTNGTFVDGKRVNTGVTFEVKEGFPICIGNIFFSLGELYSGDEPGIDKLILQDSIDLSEEFSSTGVFVKDRPMTNLKNLQLIYKVSNVLMQSLNINEILEKILDHIFDLLKRIDRGVVILIDNETGKTIELISRFNKKRDDTMMMYSQSIVRRVVEEGKAVILSDTLGADEAERSKSMELMKIRSVMCVPLISKAQVWGVIYVDSVNRPFGFRKEDLSLLTTLSSPAAVAIENARLYSNLEEIIEDRTKNLRETQEKLQESEARFKAIFNNMSSGVVIYEVVNDGEDFVIVDLNKADREIEKIQKREALGKNVTTIFPEIKDSGLKEVFKRVWETGKPEHKSVTLKKHNKETSWREYYVYRLPSGEIVSIFDDVSDKKKAEEEQAALQKQLIVSQKMESIGAFAGGTAHNFRNILQAISGKIEYLEMIYDKKPEISELSKSIYDSVEKGVDLINRLLQFSRRGEKYQMVNLDLADVIKKTYEMIGRILDKKIEVKLDLEEKLFVKGSHSFLSQVFMNLFTNARDAMPDGGRLLIEAKKKKDRVVAIVSDTGHGMDKKTLENIFDPFFTLKEVGKGTGLGLSTTHGIVKQHGGSISVSSQPGKGTRFEIHFPLVKTEEIEKPKIQKEVILGNGQKVLIVDDERATLDSLSNLINVLGYKAISVDKPVEALKNYARWGPDIVLMDRSMPKMDGITCIKEIMKTDPKAKIIILSGYSESGPDGIDDNVKNLIKGYLTKPCGMQELSSTLSQALKA